MELPKILKNGLCSTIEYQAIFNTIRELDKPNVLVFGLGYDSQVWDMLTPNAYFIENVDKWIAMNPTLKVYKVEYRSKKLPKKEIAPEEELKKLGGFPIELYDVKWDVIFVDSPVGRTHGRMKSIYKAYQLRDHKTHIFVHDYNRYTEQIYCDHFLGKPSEVIHRLAYYNPNVNESSNTVGS